MKMPMLLALLVICACTGGESPERPPNIVVVLVDDLRWDDIAVAGHPFVETPNIDRLASEGARFLNAFVATPLCSPSRSSILTGQYAHTNGIIDNTARDSASHRLPAFAIPLAAAGYQTAFIGKWHMGNDDTVRRQGMSLVPLLEEVTPPWRSSVLIEYYSDTVFPRILTMGYEAVRTERYKYIRYTELPGMDELYDLDTDPFEMDNLRGSPKGRALLPPLQAELARLQLESGYMSRH